jgi:diguanylate cyclase (GGDEF)-like protein
MGAGGETMKGKIPKKEERSLSEFQIRNIQFLTHLLNYDAVTDDIVEILRLSELDYFSLLDKYNLLEKRVNIDEKTNLLKYRSDYLLTIIKTASRIFFGIKGIVYPISFIRFDIDDFSLFNNKYGHELGDRVLIDISSIIRENSRPTDYTIRFGGEEFDVILPSTDIKGASHYCKKILEKVRNLVIEYHNEKIRIGLSGGVSFIEYQFTENKIIEIEGIEKMFQKLQNDADNALYDSKYRGKNQFCIYSPEKEMEYLKIREYYVNKRSSKDFGE